MSADAVSTPGSVAAVFAALADPRRREVVDVIARTGRASATAIAADLTVTRQAVAKHLVVLAEAGLVTSHRSGREVMYELRPAPLDAAARWLTSAAAVWDRRLAALKVAAERKS
ncbi:metalloregulator ArsR/SmtB family transcription factor [Luteipulveratus sp. YIM 133132]|uniref:ArsR/SmtB family transcription factor n=1 Tax=Luteipulveratus flavus TaxID=3031728 RepID=UPI0023AFB33A|nr:metalloregulator ArsR/SmtB family transcription factor [Luteipulveratus sp. YIM 133132]MDE9366694.1 metalloregulator ArsR/SmtB family transcription factor [Luteipulveratus sp. YIM 133132]